MSRFLPLLALAAAWAVPLAGPTGSTLRLGVNIAIFATVAIGLQIIWGFCGQPSFGQAALYGVGAYALAILTVRHGMAPWPALAAATACGAAAGVVLGLPSLRVSAEQVALVTFALGEVLRVVEANASFTGGSGGLAGVAPLTIGSRELLSAADLYRPALALVAVSYVAARWLRGSASGRAMLAVRADEVAARTMGVRPGPLKLFAFGLGGALAGLAGGFSASFSGFVSSVSFGIVPSFQVVVMVVLGGLGRVGGAIVGAAVVMIIDDQLQSRPSIRLGVTGAAMILVVLVRAGSVRAAGEHVRVRLRRACAA